MFLVVMTAGGFFGAGHQIGSYRATLLPPTNLRLAEIPGPPQNLRLAREPEPSISLLQFPIETPDCYQVDGYLQCADPNCKTNGLVISCEYIGEGWRVSYWKQ